MTSGEFLDRIITADETWVAQITPEINQQSIHLRHSESPCKTKFKQTLSMRKVMCTVFWAKPDIRLVDVLTRDETVNAERYCDTLKKLRRAIQNKRLGMLVLVLSFCTITLGHTRLDGQHISCRSLAGWYLIIHPITRTSRLVISNFSYPSSNSCLVTVSVFRTRERRRWVLYSGSNPRRQTIYGYKSWPHGMKKFLNSGGEYVENSSTLDVRYLLQ